MSVHSQKVKINSGLNDQKMPHYIKETAGIYVYEGWNLVTNNTGDDHWQIKRTKELSNITTVDYAGGGGFIHTWDDRYDYFPVVKYSEVSTTFDGVNESAFNSSGLLDFDRTDAFSASYWVKIPELPDNQSTVIGKMIGSAIGWRFFIGIGGNPGLFISYNSTTRLFSSARENQIPVGVWTHVVTTYDGSSAASGVTTYRDGVPCSMSIVYDSLTGGSTLTTGVPVRVGVDNSLGSTYHYGQLDDIVIFSKRLSPTEVIELWNYGVTKDPRETSVSGSISAYWRMGDNDVYPIIEDVVGENDLIMLNMGPENFTNDVP